MLLSMQAAPRAPLPPRPRSTAPRTTSPPPQRPRQGPRGEAGRSPPALDAHTPPVRSRLQKHTRMTFEYRPRSAVQDTTLGGCPRQRLVLHGRRARAAPCPASILTVRRPRAQGAPRHGRAVFSVRLGVRLSWGNRDWLPAARGPPQGAHWRERGRLLQIDAESASITVHNSPQTPPSRQHSKCHFLCIWASRTEELATQFPPIEL